MKEGRESNKLKFLLYGCGGLLAAILILAILVLLRPNAPSADESDKSETVIGKVSKLYLVPNNEAPTVAAIQDKDKITQNKSFFENAENGDYLLVYKNARLALIYRESADKLVNVAPVNTGPTEVDK